MAEGGSSECFVKIKVKKNGQVYSAKIDPSLAAMLNLPDCDQAVKQSIIDEVVRQNTVQKQYTVQEQYNIQEPDDENNNCCDENNSCQDENNNCRNENNSCQSENDNCQDKKNEMKDTKVKCTNDFYIENMKSNVKVKNHDLCEKNISELLCFDNISSDQSTKCFSDCLSAVSILSGSFDEDGSIQIAPNCVVTQKEFSKMISNQLEMLVKKKIEKRNGNDD